MNLNPLTCVITGATSGIGRAAALALAGQGANLVLLGRNKPAGQQAARQIEAVPEHGHVEFVPVDLSAMAQVREAAQAIAARHPTIDVLINNAGARFDISRKSADGVELTFATNHLGHFLLTGLLLKSLLAAPGGRVITVSSGSHAAARLEGGWLPAGPFDRRQAYARSKLANLVFAYTLADRFKESRITSNAVDPGGVASNFARNNGLKSWLRHLVSHVLHGGLKSPRQGADTLVYLATAPEVSGMTAKYFSQRREISSSALSHDPQARRDLWNLSLKLTGMADSQWG